MSAFLTSEKNLEILGKLEDVRHSLKKINRDAQAEDGYAYASLAQIIDSCASALRKAKIIVQPFPVHAAGQAGAGIRFIDRASGEWLEATMVFSVPPDNCAIALAAVTNARRAIYLSVLNLRMEEAEPGSRGGAPLAAAPAAPPAAPPVAAHIAGPVKSSLRVARELETKLGKTSGIMYAARMVRETTGESTLAQADPAGLASFIDRATAHLDNVGRVAPAIQTDPSTTPNPAIAG